MEIKVLLCVAAVLVAMVGGSLIYVNIKSRILFRRIKIGTKVKTWHKDTMAEGHVVSYNKKGAMIRTSCVDGNTIYKPLYQLFG